MSEPTTPVVWLTMISGHAFANSRDDGYRNLRVPGRQVAEARLETAKMHMDDTRTLIEGAPRLARHLLRRYRRRIDGGVGQHAGQRAGEDGLVHLQASPSATTTNRSSRAFAWPPCAAAARVMTPSIGERMEYCIFIASTVARACPRRT